METAVRFTPLCGVSEEEPLCYLLEIDSFTILLDCGWDESFDEALLEPVKKVWGLVHCSRPCRHNGLVVLATMPSLDSGPARQLLVDWAGQPRNTIIFTERANSGTLASCLQNHVPGPEPLRLPLRLATRVPLEGEELAAWQAAKAAEAAGALEEARRAVDAMGGSGERAGRAEARHGEVGMLTAISIDPPQRHAISRPAARGPGPAPLLQLEPLLADRDAAMPGGEAAAAATAAASGSAGTGSVLLAQAGSALTLSKLKAALAAAGFESHFPSRGVLAVMAGGGAGGGTLVVTLGGGGGSTDRAHVMLEGPASEAYFKVREVIYEQFGVC
ncbi:Cleavage and polyadenylation specificity factor subunit 2 [Tetrabaena socialis]|uniref:Cleavage and polyadenylation specificity factor subunit 2 n=1 Tax=Tetrabaena socialis TaxID=47790 RepID=A0A2J8ABN0_9CHLO|nr:Cleavage and polyadenylation specificity factor subunit 2 [Tetrabaena socialis]|eukprot:PNH09934.1 Cleavage and polyadenylation specificity factor subunit 2 [Tetrabaena socialis]